MIRKIEWLNIYLPTESAAFGNADLTQDRGADLWSVEKNARPDVSGQPPAAGDVR